MLRRALITLAALTTLVACSPTPAPAPPPEPAPTSTPASTTPEPTPLPEPGPQPPLPSPEPPAPPAPGCAAPVVCTTADSDKQLRITRPGVYDGQGHRVPNILIRASGVTVRNFRVSGGTQAGIWSEGANNVIEDNDISQIAYGDDDLDAMRFFGDGTRILRNHVHNLVRGPLKDAHPDGGAQTYAHSLPGSSHILIEGNTWEGFDFHQCLMAEGPGSTDGGGGGGGVSRDWVIRGNHCEGTSNQAIALRGISDVQIIDNVFAGRNAKAVQITDGSTGVTFSGNKLGPDVRQLSGD